MKIRIKSGDCPRHLKMGKFYEAKEVSASRMLYIITDEFGRRIHVYLPECEHLNGGSWEIVNE